MEQRPKAGLTKFQRFTVATVAGFAYAVINTRLFLSFNRCLFVGFGKNSVIAQLTGFGIALVSTGMQYLVTWETMLGIFRFLLSTFTIKVAKTKVLNENDLTFNRKEYQSYSNLYNCYSPINGWV